LNTDLVDAIREQNELLMAIYITAHRSYDVLAAMFAEQNKARANELVKLHESGQFLTGPPAYTQEEEWKKTTSTDS
jgi:hypothetical protein